MMRHNISYCATILLLILSVNEIFFRNLDAILELL